MIVRINSLLKQCQSQVYQWGDHMIEDGRPRIPSATISFGRSLQQQRQQYASWAIVHSEHQCSILPQDREEIGAFPNKVGKADVWQRLIRVLGRYSRQLTCGCCPRVLPIERGDDGTPHLVCSRCLRVTVIQFELFPIGLLLGIPKLSRELQPQVFCPQSFKMSRS